MARLLRRVETIVPRRARGYGGKARSLAALARAGFPVPAAWALPGEACQQFLRANLDEEDLPHALLAPGTELPTPAQLERIAERVRNAPMPADLAEGLTEAYAKLCAEGAHAVAVRSSSTREDQEEAAAAGLHATFLQVTGERELLDAVRACWASVYAPQVLSYLKTVPGEADAAVGVVVQAMVPAEVSGVLFTVNPLTGDPDEMVINCSWGLGCALVEGRVSPDTLRIDKESGAPRDRIMGDKTVRAVPDPDGGVREEPVPQELRERLCVDDAVVEDLVNLGNRIERHFGEPRDIEWALVEGQICVLQARPVTTSVGPSTRKRSRKKRASRFERSKIVWSNVNVGEALPGVATPLTWSVASNFSELGFRRAFQSVGCPVPKDVELVGNFRGRIYLNVSEILEALAQVPGLRPKTLLSLGGGGEIEHLEREIERRNPMGFLARVPMTATRFARENFRITKKVEAFEHSYQTERHRMTELDLRVLSPAALDKVLSDIQRLLDEAGSVMLTAYGNLLSTIVALQAVLRIVARDRADALQRDLITGLADVDSAAPGLSLWHIAEMARADEPAREVLASADASELQVSDLPAGPTRRALENFLAAFGYRGTREAEIAEPRWNEDPTLLFATLRLHLEREASGDKPIDVERRQRQVREQAEAELDRLLPAVGRAAVRHVLALVQRFTRLRERLRGHVVEVLGMFRRVALDASRRLERSEREAGSDAAFFLTLDELRGVLRGEIRRVSPLVNRRRQQFERDRSLPDPPATFVGYPPPVPPPPPDTDALTGLGASAGRAEGVARVLETPADVAAFHAGEILVTACADVGWSPVFLVAAAVVTDLGGPLSHASIVLREYGVPAVVNLKAGTRVIRTGDRVLVDADAGVVRILERAPDAERGATDVSDEQADAAS